MKHRILNRIVQDNPELDTDDYVETFRNLLRVVHDEYILYQKKCAVLQDMLNPKSHIK